LRVVDSLAEDSEMALIGFAKKMPDLLRHLIAGHNVLRSLR